ncbi:MAG: CBS domain-containing protein [Opitutales bacterium]|nr:CBS domain-containing protein [Opitutales bacterium]
MTGLLDEMMGARGSSISGTLALVGMGAMFAGIIRAPVTSILIIFELTGDYNLILPIMAANLSAYAISSRLRQVPIYESLLLEDGINLRKFPILRLNSGWQSLPVSVIMTNTVHTLEGRLPLEHAYLKIKDERFKIYPVVDSNGKYVGMVHRKGITVVSQKDPDKLVQEFFVAQDFPKVYPDMKSRDVANRFVDTEWSALPVISRLDEGCVVGVVTLHDIKRQQFLQERES